MAAKIRLQRRGHKGYAFYSIVIADSRAPRDGKFIEKIGTYNPNTNPATVDLNFERALYWVMVLEVVETLDRVDRHIVLLRDLREIVAALHDVHRVFALRRRKRLHVLLLDNLLLYDALAVGSVAPAGLGVLRPRRTRAVLLIDDGSADRGGVGLDLRPDILHVGRLRRFAMIVGILAAGDHSDRGNS